MIIFSLISLDLCVIMYIFIKYQSKSYMPRIYIFYICIPLCSFEMPKYIVHLFVFF